MAYTAAKEVCTPAELNRFACAFLNCKDIHQAIDWDAAAKQFDPAVKPASFKTVTQKAMKKVFEKAKEGGGGSDGCGDGREDEGGKKGKAGGAKGKKRKAAAATADEDGGEGEEGEDGAKPAAKKGKGGGKKAKKGEVASDGEERDADVEAGDKVKSEEDEDELAF